MNGTEKKLFCTELLWSSLVFFGLLHFFFAEADHSHKKTFYAHTDILQSRNKKCTERNGGDGMTKKR